ncbi:MAG TPA: hypothetical protein VN708_09965, partial [Terriglobales bacterium]|nr:hypothetical protein [Terriglobales bacterium]
TVTRRSGAFAYMKDCKNKAATAATREKPEGAPVQCSSKHVAGFLSTVPVQCFRALLLLPSTLILMN